MAQPPKPTQIVHLGQIHSIFREKPITKCADSASPVLKRYKHVMKVPSAHCLNRARWVVSRGAGWVTDRLYQIKGRFKNWPRQWKINLIEKFNPEWRDLYEEICL